MPCHLSLVFRLSALAPFLLLLKNQNKPCNVWYPPNIHVLNTDSFYVALSPMKSLYRPKLHKANETKGQFDFISPLKRKWQLLVSLTLLPQLSNMPGWQGPSCWRVSSAYFIGSPAKVLSFLYPKTMT